MFFLPRVCPLHDFGSNHSISQGETAKKKITLLKEKRKRLFEKKQHLDSKARHLTTELSTIAQRGRVRKWFERLIE
jgi:hypothetical protein